jgi:hypothetical protein
MKIKKAIVPLPIDAIKEYFQDKDIMFLVDYENSKLENKIFLTYVSNLDIPIDVTISDTFPEDKLFELIDAYMDVKTISDVPFLNMIVAHIMLKAIGANTGEALVNTFLTEEQAQLYIDSRQDKVNHWKHFLDSGLLFLIYSYTELNEKLKVEDAYPKVEDANYVGLNVVNLLKIPGFLNCYFSVSTLPTVSFFTEQFTKYMFKGRSFFDYFNNEENTFIPLLIALVENKLPIDPAEIFKDDAVV